MNRLAPFARSAVGMAMLGAGAVTAQFIAGKATRDALFLGNLDVTSLPLMVIATAGFSLVAVGASSRALRRSAPARLVPWWFAASAVLFFAEWGLVSIAPRVAAPLVYLHVSGIGPLFGSGFWLVTTERFDPHTAKLRFGQIAGMGTLGGLVGGLLAERVAAVVGASAMLPVLGVLNLLCAWLVGALARSGDAAPPSGARIEPPSLGEPAPLSAEPPQSGLRVLARAPYLRSLAALVVLGTVGASLVDYVFKAQAVTTLGRGDGLLRFFAIYYTATSVMTFAVQTALSRLTLERLGLGFAVSTPSLALLAGATGGLVAPGLESVVAARGGESMFRASLFRSAYELFYTPVSPRERRAAKSLIDVGFDRLGDAVGGATVRVVLLLVPAAERPVLLALAIGCALAALVVARRLNQGYVRTLERSLLDRAVELDLGDIQDLSTRTVVLKTLAGQRPDTLRRLAALEGPAGETFAASAPALEDPVIADIAVLKSRAREAIFPVLHRPEGLSAALVPHVIPLLAWDAVADSAVHALRKVAEERVGLLIDALIDPNQDFAIRRRLARVFSVCVSQRAVDGLFLGLDDLRFEVRFQCGRSLAAIQERNPLVRIDRDRMLEVVLREAAVSRPVWESHRLLDRLDDSEPRTFVDGFLRDRTNQSLAHVFTLLSLILPSEPLRIAYHGLHSQDERLRGTALEYLEGVLPPAVRERLWPFLDEGRPAVGATRPREAIMADLMRLNQSIVISLAEFRQHADLTAESAPPGVAPESERSEDA
jgi:hypothetical protein